MSEFTSDVRLPQAVIARYIIELAIECVEWEQRHIDVESDTYSLHDLDPSECIVECIEYDDTLAVSVTGNIEGTDYRKVSSATRFQPADYESTSVEIAVSLVWIPERFAMTDEVVGAMEQLDSGFSEPDPEPRWRDC